MPLHVRVGVLFSHTLFQFWRKGHLFFYVDSKFICSSITSKVIFSLVISVSSLAFPYPPGVISFITRNWYLPQAQTRLCCMFANWCIFDQRRQVRTNVNFSIDFQRERSPESYLTVFSPYNWSGNLSVVDSHQSTWSKWKHAIVYPGRRQQKRDKRWNYRIVSLLSLRFEHHVTHWMWTATYRWRKRKQDTKNSHCGSRSAK